MFKSAILTAASVGLLLTASFVLPGAASARVDQKREDPSAPPLSPKLRARLLATEKAAPANKAAAARPSSEGFVEAGARAVEFAARAQGPRAASAASPAELPMRLHHLKPHVGVDAKAGANAVPPFDGRRGTGLGDVFEVDSGEDPDLAQVVPDLPANIVGEINGFDDVDFYAFTATRDEYIRVEVVADRIFDSSLDSYLYLVDDEEDVIATNDDAFGSNDSFISFRAPYTGMYFVGVTDTEGFSGNNFDYVLNISPSREDIEEDESNDRTSRADFLPVPSMAFADSDDDEDQDVFKFTGTAGQALIIDVDAEVFESEADMVVELLDREGRFIFGSDDFDGRDPRFNIVLPYSGTFYLLAYDLNRDEGSRGHYYSLNISTQSAALAPVALTFKTTGGLLRVVRGTGFDPSDGGSKVEIDALLQPSFNVPARPTTDVRLSPRGYLSGSDTITVVNPDGRRSNPIILR
jgi:hypothetical protein